MKPYHFSDNRFAAYIDSAVNEKEVPFDPHFHEGYELLYLIEGSTRIIINKRTYTAYAGDLIIYRPGIVHKEYIQPGSIRLICLRFPKNHVKISLPESASANPVYRLPWKNRFIACLEQIVLEQKGIDQWSAQMQAVYLKQFVILLWRAITVHKREVPVRGERRARLGAVLDLLNTHDTEDNSLQALAYNAFMSESHFRRLFREEMGMSPKRYAISIRIQKALELLEKSDQTNKEIATALGFESSHYFCRHFKREYGCTPGEYRSKSRKVHND